MTFLKSIEQNPFYSLITNYIVGCHGTTDLISRGGVNLVIKHGLTKEKLLAANSIDSNVSVDHKINLFIDNPVKTPLLADIKLKNSVDSNSIDIDIDELADYIYEKSFDPILNVFQNARILIITAYETTKSHNDHSPIWEFFRHIRNASAHEGNFNLVGNEPRRLAEWNGLQIISSLNGTPLFKGQNTQHAGFIYPGDVIKILLDIGDQYPISINI